MYAVLNHAFPMQMFIPRNPAWRPPKGFLFNLAFGVETKTECLAQNSFTGQSTGLSKIILLLLMEHKCSVCCPQNSETGRHSKPKIAMHIVTCSFLTIPFDTIRYTEHLIYSVGQQTEGLRIPVPSAPFSCSYS
jgi:hypothetical protein